MSWRWHLAFLLLWGAGGVLFLSLFPRLFGLFSWSFLAFWVMLAFLPALQAFLFSRKKGTPFFRALGQAILAFFHYPHFLWIIRPGLPLSAEEEKALLLEASRFTRVKNPSSFLCPFCQVEIPGALKTLPQGTITARTVPLLCPRCQTRFDVCRYCVFFEPEARRGLEEGKCAIIKKVQNVDEVCVPSVARKLKEMGWFTLHTGIPVTDSFHRPEECHSFQFDEAKTTLDHIPWMGKTRYLLLKIEEGYSHSSSGSRSS